MAEKCQAVVNTERTYIYNLYVGVCCIFCDPF